MCTYERPGFRSGLPYSLPVTGVTLWVLRPSLIHRTVVPATMFVAAGSKKLSRMWMVTVLWTACTRRSTRADAACGPRVVAASAATTVASATPSDHVFGASKVRASSTSVRTPKPVPPLVT